jgi:flagellar P-ring protein precursor FlgI
MNRSALLRLLAIPLVLAALFTAPSARADHLRDLCDVVGVRENQLLGYGVVTGLNGTGDDVSAPFAAQSLMALMRRLGVQIDPVQLRLRNVAAVLVTATMPAFARQGSKLDVVVSSIGNGRSLQGGVLLQTLLNGADTRVYAVAQGPLVVGGFEARANSGSSVRANTTNTARVPSGAMIEREVNASFVTNDAITLALRSADFTTAQRIVSAIDEAFGAGTASSADPGAVRVKLPATLKAKPVELLAKLQDIDVPPVSNARIVVNERTGTIVAGGDVRLAPSAIAHGGITIVIRETPAVSQPGPLAQGATTTVPQSDIQSIEGGPQPGMKYMAGAGSLADVARALTTLGVPPRELASILQALKSAGALHAEVVVQ